MQERAQMRQIRKKQNVRLERQLALRLLQDAMSKVEKGRSTRETGYSDGTPTCGSDELAVGVPGGPEEIVEHADAEHPYHSVIITPDDQALNV
jgi:hypothetical protein